MDVTPTPLPRKQNQRNYYRILFVQPDAPMEIVQASYRTIMQKLKAHPDLGGDTWNASIINEAYQTLIDPNRRIHYDQSLFADHGINKLGLQSTANRESGSADDDSTGGHWEEFTPQQL